MNITNHLRKSNGTHENTLSMKCIFKKINNRNQNYFQKIKIENENQKTFLIQHNPRYSSMLSQAMVPNMSRVM